MSAVQADFDDAVLGSGLPAPVEALIKQAGRLRSQPEQALALLKQARALAPTHPAPLIALYRFYFYANRLVECRDVAVEALRMALTELGLPPYWREVGPDQRFRELQVLPRFFLFCLKGYAYLSLRVDDIEVAESALRKLAELDPDDKTGHKVLAQVLARRDVDEYEYWYGETQGAGA